MIGACSQRRASIADAGRSTATYASPASSSRLVQLVEATDPSQAPRAWLTNPDPLLPTRTGGRIR